MLQEINENSGTQTMWAKISQGMIVIPADETDPKAKSRTNKVGKTVWERFYKSIAGHIKTLSVEENKFGETDIRIGLENDENKAVLTIALDSSYGRGFLNQIFNVDLTKQIAFTPWQKVLEDGTKRSNLYLNYSKNEKVEYKLPAGCPEVKWVDTKKGKVIDPVSKAEHDDFLDKKLQEFIKDNNLVYSNGLSSINDAEWNEMSQPLSAEEQKQLVKPKAKKEKINSEIVDGDLNDLFDDL
jgi:hypothetical protein